MEELTRKLSLGVTGLAAIVAASTAGRSAEIKPVPQETTWAADGQEHIVFIQVDNHDLGDEPTDSVQWKLQNLPPFGYTNCEPPSENDFFGERPMFYELWEHPSGLSGRVVDEIGGGPVNYIGNAGQFRATAPVGMAPGQYVLEFDSDTGLSSPTATRQQPVTLSTAVITVIPPCVPNGPSGNVMDRDNDGDVDLTDFSGFAEYMSGPAESDQGCGDFNGDGHSDIRDYALFQQAYTGSFD